MNKLPISCIFSALLLGLAISDVYANEKEIGCLSPNLSLKMLDSEDGAYEISGTVSDSDGTIIHEPKLISKIGHPSVLEFNGAEGIKLKVEIDISEASGGATLYSSCTVHGSPIATTRLRLQL